MVRQIGRLLGGASAVALVCLMVIVLVDVVGRSLFNRPLASGTELTEILMALMAFLSFPLLAYRQRDITVDLLDTVTGHTTKKIQAALSGVFGALVFGLLAWQLAVFAHRAMSNGETTAELQFPLSYLWWLMSALAVVTAVAALVVVFKAFAGHPGQTAHASKVD